MIFSLAWSGESSTPQLHVLEDWVFKEPEIAAQSLFTITSSLRLNIRAPAGCHCYPPVATKSMRSIIIGFACCCASCEAPPAADDFRDNDFAGNNLG